MSVNGTEREIVPLNSHKEGIKIIRTGEEAGIVGHTQYITEPIQDASLRILIWAANETQIPHLGQIKICSRGAAGNE